ncbi:uroporphyrinogen-III C-methyltransferase [Methyloversatilis thermotolerans]|uniref:uroporphyrinogen-III C-methyltransferase n=1 Tax=Methyloversatilis thermotolerans TaxID=1346290 RepID=UPI0003A1B531|nr:uroporphyrinogen-III C-methyltransferase [Methyloversatilis thermotolerans]
MDTPNTGDQPSSHGRKADVAAGAANVSSSRDSSPALLWALVVALLVVAAAGGAWMYKRMQALEAALQRSEAPDATGVAPMTQMASSPPIAAGVDAQLSEMRARIDAFEFLADDLVRSYDEQLLAEVEHALILGQQQLQLAGDAKLALNALSTAEIRLARVDTGRFLPLRRAMANDMERLRRSPMADLSGQALRIDTLIGSVDSLPLAFERSPGRDPDARKPAVAGAGGTAPTLVERLAAEVWSEVRQLVRVERLDRPDPALLAPEHAVFLRENLKLRLINARVALLQRNGVVWRNDITLARTWLERYFDLHARQTDNALTTLRQLAMLDPGEALPGLNESISALAQLKAQRQRLPVVQKEKR